MDSTVRTCTAFIVKELFKDIFSHTAVLWLQWNHICRDESCSPVSQMCKNGRHQSQCALGCSSFQFSSFLLPIDADEYIWVRGASFGALVQYWLNNVAPVRFFVMTDARWLSSSYGDQNPRAISQQFQFEKKITSEEMLTAWGDVETR
jgi:hypothetical protein